MESRAPGRTRRRILHGVALRTLRVTEEYLNRRAFWSRVLWGGHGGRTGTVSRVMKALLINYKSAIFWIVIQIFFSVIQIILGPFTTPLS